MGAGLNVVCRTCKKDYYCGYGSYRSMDARASNLPDECKQHDTVRYTEDYTETVTNTDGTLDLWLSHQWLERVIVADIGSYEQVDLTEGE